jgi:hypothetical protein
MWDLELELHGIAEWEPMRAFCWGRCPVGQKGWAEAEVQGVTDGKPKETLYLPFACRCLMGDCNVWKDMVLLSSPLLP